MRLTTAAILAALLGSTPAMAQDGKPFEGASVTVIAGADITTTENDKTLLTFGAQAGYDWQNGSLVFGVEGEATGRTHTGCSYFLQPADGYRACDKGGHDLYVGGKIGTALGDATLLYAKAGYTNRSYSGEFQLVKNGPEQKRSGSSGGFRVGAGIEQRVTDSVSLKAEYRFSKYDSLVDLHQVVGGVGFHF